MKALGRCAAVVVGVGLAVTACSNPSAVRTGGASDVKADGTAQVVAKSHTVRTNGAEAAEIDGASRFHTYRHMILPLLIPVLRVGAVVMIITIWNETFFAAFLLPSDASMTLPLALYRFASASPEQAFLRWNLIVAHVVLTSLPLVVVYLSVQRRVVSGLSEGALKAS
jgi:ABC-type glycerol-3-phosphate transport system permease component